MIHCFLHMGQELACVTVPTHEIIEQVAHHPRVVPQIPEHEVDGEVERIHHAVLAFVHHPEGPQVKLMKAPMGECCALKPTLRERCRFGHRISSLRMIAARRSDRLLNLRDNYRRQTLK